LNIENVSFTLLDQKTAEAAADLAIQTGLRGMDALVVQTAMEFGSELVTFDDEMMKRSKVVLKNK
jgi:predicted nucleic acid-binding protein